MVETLVGSSLDHPVGQWLGSLASGTGIKAWTQTQSSGMATGTINFVIGHPIVYVHAWPIVCFLDWLTNIDQAPRIFADAYWRFSKSQTSDQPRPTQVLLTHLNECIKARHGKPTGVPLPNNRRYALWQSGTLTGAVDPTIPSLPLEGTSSPLNRHPLKSAP